MIELHMAAGTEAVTIEQVKLIALQFPGEHALEMQVPVGTEKWQSPSGTLNAWPRVTTIAFGPEWRYDGSPACMAALNEFGSAVLTDAGPDGRPRRR